MSTLQCSIKNDGATGRFERVQVTSVGVRHQARVRQQCRQALRRKAADHVVGLETFTAPSRPICLNQPAATIATELRHPTLQPQFTTIAMQSLDQTITQGLHRPLEMPQAVRRLRHLQHRGAVQSCGAISRLLGIQLQLKVEKASQSRIPSTTANRKEIGDGHSSQKTRRERGGTQSTSELPQIPQVAWSHNRITPGESPVALVNALAQSPETVAARKLALTLDQPAIWVVPERNWWGSVAEIHQTPGIEQVCFWEIDPQVFEQARMAAAGFETCNLSGADVECPGTSPKGSCATPDLAMGLKKRDSHPLMSHQGSCSETGDSATDHNHVRPAHEASRNRGMLATSPGSCA